MFTKQNLPVIVSPVCAGFIVGNIFGSWKAMRAFGVLEDKNKKAD